MTKETKDRKENSMTDKQKLEKIKVLADAMYNRMQNLTTDTSGIRKAMYDYHQFIIHEYYKEEPVSEDLMDATNNYCVNVRKGYPRVMDETDRYICNAFKAGAKWKVENLWKPADGDDLPEYDREVIAILDYDFGHYKVVYAHRPNPNGWDGTNIDTGEKEHFEPATYGKGGWNQPHILYWLDARLPYEEK